jgi:hypothetical protein
MKIFTQLNSIVSGIILFCCACAPVGGTLLVEDTALASTQTISSQNIENSILIHIKTSLKHDDAQICVAYNEIWAALSAGMDVRVLIDADAVNTYKFNWLGNDKLGGYKMPENLRQTLAKQFETSLGKTPHTYGDYIQMLNKKGAKFYINSSMLVVAGIEDKLGETKNLTVDFFKPITLKEMMGLVRSSEKYLVY